MNVASEFDIGPLTWVKTEIDLALERATEALTQYAGSSDVTHLKFARTHIHQAHGALAIVGLDGVTQISESLEALLVLLEEGQSTAAAHVFDAFDISLGAIRQYLDDLLAGAPNQPLRLLPAYKALAEARGLTNCHAADLFYPDLSPRPGKRPAPETALEPEAQKALIKTERAHYQKALLTFLKKPDEAAQAIEGLSKAIAAIEALQDTPANRAFWWISLAFIETLKQAEIGADPRARQLCSHIDGQIRRLLEGTRTVAERLMRDALYFIAQAPAAEHPLIAELQEIFELRSLLPDAQPPEAAQPHESSLRRLREALSASEESWNKFCAGSGNTLAGFAEQARLCSTLANDIGHTDLKRLAQAFAAIANWLAETPSRHADSIAMEVATAILLLQSAMEHFRHLGTDFAQQVDLMVARLYGCIAGNPVSDQGLPALDEMTRQAQEDEISLRKFQEQASIRNSLTRELNHRVKNTLANVLSIIALTRRRSTNLDDFADGLDGRIRALSAPHDLLTQSDWGATPIRAVVQAELRPYAHDADHAVEMQGPDVQLAPNDALSLGLAMHELATNASKYGALSRPGGQVTVHWKLESETLVRIEWLERGGPEVKVERGRGFGMDLIERIVAEAEAIMRGRLAGLVD